ncbi:glycosyltransferase family 2 protein [Pseudooceanicola algae]|uniref:Glycosyl transferase family 2 n=1 Tax=Pseudooceanicola algae TaxID=1537215 RepID=A0A418SF39_9RHOB|nr:glycosyltransferase family 2 protein [Pseudooceanicola algae]QPM89294.1 hypothetical protein PSAL_005090 [Pseudooceanicola algae]
MDRGTPPDQAPTRAPHFEAIRTEVTPNVVLPGPLSAQPTWGIVSTVKAPLADIARFAAWHLTLGASQVHLFLDVPDPATEAFLQGDPRIEVTACDDAYWQRVQKDRPASHQRRQFRNASLCYRNSGLDWLAHVDVDEFLMPPDDLMGILAQAPEDIAQIQILPAERLAGSQSHFKLTARFAGQDPSVLHEIYPTYGAYLRGGYVSHLEGKAIVRTGLPGCRLGLHTLRRNKAPITNVAVLHGTWLGHAHVTDWASFRDKLAFRLEKGSYRNQRPRFGLGELLGFLQEDGGEPALRAFFDEVCADTPRLRAALQNHGMLLTRDLALDACCERVFGCHPKDLPA